jgi:hypothetical protein
MELYAPVLSFSLFKKNPIAREFTRKAFNLVFQGEIDPRCKAKRQHSQSSAHYLGGFVSFPPTCGDIINTNGQRRRGRFDPSHLKDAQSIGETNDLSLKHVHLLGSLSIFAGPLIRIASAARWPGTVAFLKVGTKV